mmetsp:Transcript_13448/g.27440  ORF Transcript_13448/g.27440 Transcript_13448/m.27440 type:complete len:471 (+) Transcript_13448:105-1517(+)
MSWEEDIFVAMCFFKLHSDRSQQTIEKAAAGFPTFQVNQQFLYEQPSGRLLYGALALSEADAANVKHLFHHGDTLLDAAHRFGPGPEATALRALLRRLGGQVCNLAEEETKELLMQHLPCPGTPTDVSAFSPASTPSSLNRTRASSLCPEHLDTAAALATIYTTGSAAASFFIDPLQLGAVPTNGTLRLLHSSSSSPLLAQQQQQQQQPTSTPPWFLPPSSPKPPMDEQPSASVGEVWKLTLPQVLSPLGDPSVSSTQFPFDASLGVWRCEVPSSCLSNPLVLAIGVSASGSRALAESGLRLDVEACVLPSPGIADGAGMWPTHLVASLSPLQTGVSAASFSVSWPRVNPGGGGGALPHAVVLFVCARTHDAFVNTPLSSTGELDTLFEPLAPPCPQHQYQPEQQQQQQQQQQQAWSFPVPRKWVQAPFSHPEDGFNHQQQQLQKQLLDAPNTYQQKQQQRPFSSTGAWR